MSESKNLKPLDISPHFLYNRVGDDILLAKFRNRENLQLLEHLIDKVYNEDYKPISMQKESLDYGKKLRRADLERVLGDSKEETDRFLGLDFEDKPSIGSTGIFENDGFTNLILGGYALGSFLLGASMYAFASSPHSIFTSLLYGLWASGGLAYLNHARKNHRILKDNGPCFYHTLFKKVRVDFDKKYMLDREVGLRTALNHEYPHFLIDKLFFEKTCDSNIKSGDFNIFDEGFAEGVEEAIGRKNYEKTGNAAWIFSFLDIHIDLLYQAYLDIAKQAGFKTSDSLAKMLCDFTQLKSENLPDYNDHLLHAYGKALFKTLEFKYGPFFYKDIAKGNLMFF